MDKERGEEDGGRKGGGGGGRGHERFSGEWGGW